MDVIKKLSKFFQINWLTIKTGYFDMPKEFTRISDKLVIDYALHYIKEHNSNSNSIEFELASLYEHEIDRIKECLIHLAELANSTEKIEQDKYRVLFLINKTLRRACCKS